ncbi:MAG: Omp28-related outer membrane protein [Saprospiraceae bacterium]|nr:Omp28-related outer membrane protein [Saprospiraceae bacterium]
MNKILFFLLFIPVLFYSSCVDEVPIEIPEFQLNNSEKVVLVEELTGVHCINCPDGAITLKNIEAQYPGKIAVIAIHAGALSDPFPNSKYDLRCEDGINIEKRWTYLGKPAAVIDRIIFEEPDIPVSGYTSWQQYIQKQLNDTVKINIEASVDFDTLKREGRLNIALLPIEDLQGQFKVYAALTEDHIVDLQVMKNGTINENYEFENVLRDMITPFNGLDIGSEMKKNTIVTRTFDFSIPKSDGTWIPKNMNVVAFVSANLDNTYEKVKNAVKVKLIK